MKVPVKFKGESAIGTVYGFYVIHEGKAYIMNEVGTKVSVDENSVRQLMGYDAEGKEIYQKI